MTQTSAFFLKRAAVSLTVPLGLTRAICLAIDSLGSVGAVIACSTDAKRESISCCLITFLVALTTRFCQVPSDFFSRFLRSEEHTSELQSLMRISYAVFCLKKKKKTKYYNIISNDK